METEQVCTMQRPMPLFTPEHPFYLHSVYDFQMKNTHLLLVLTTYFQAFPDKQEPIKVMFGSVGGRMNKFNKLKMLV